MKRFTTLLLVLALTLTTILSVIPFGAFADTATELTDNSGYGGGIRKKSDGSILFSPFMADFKALIDGGANIASYTIDMTFTQLDGNEGKEVYTFDTVSAAINKSNGYYYDIYLNGKLGNSGFCPTAGAYYNVYVEIYQDRTTDSKGTKVFYGTYTNMQAASAISSSSYYDPTPIPVDAPQITETTEGYEGNITYKGEGIRKRSSGQISFCPYITELRALVDGGTAPSDYVAELTFSLLEGENGAVVREFDPIKITPENGTGYFYLTLADGNGSRGFIPTAGEYYDIEVNIYNADGEIVTYGTYKSIKAQDAIADSEYYAPTPLKTQITETKDDYTGTKLYKNGIRMNSAGAIMVSAFMSEVRAAVNAGTSADAFKIKTVFTLLEGDGGKEVATFPEITLTPNKSSNGQYFDIPLKGSGFCPTAGSYYNIAMEVYEDGVLKYFGTYKNIVALDAISGSADYMPTPVPGAPADYDISLSYSFNNALKGSAAGTVYFSVDKAGYFEITWGDKDGKPLTTTVGAKTLTYSELVKFNVKATDGASYAEKIISFTAIPQGAETLIVLDGAGNVVKSLALPADKLQPTDGYEFTFGAISDLHYEYFYTNEVDDAIYAVDTALAFYEAAGSKLVVAAGDYSKYTEEAAYQKYQTAVNKVKIPVIACSGNHEVYTIAAETMYSATGYWRTYMNNGVYNGTLEGVLDIADNGVDFAYSYPGLEDYVFISLQQWRWDGHTASQDCLLTDSQLLWLEEMFETYKDKTVYLLFHTYLGDDDYESIDGEGDMVSPGGYTYGAFYNKYTKDEKVFRALLDQYENVIWFNGHSHYEYSIQKYNENLNIFDYMGTTATMIHVPSVTNLRTVTDTSTGYSGLHGKASQGALMFVYDDYQIMNGVDLWEEEILSYACYIVYDDKTEIVEDGTVSGTDITWTWDAQLNSLRVMGSGEMPDFTAENPAPWAKYLNEVMTVYVGKGITSVGANAFAGAAKLATVEIKDDVTEIGEKAFAKTAVSTLILPEGLKIVAENAFESISSIASITFTGSKESYDKITIAPGNDALFGNVTFKKYQITWVVGDTSTTVEFKVGEVPTYDGIPAKDHTDPNKHYVFTGWSSNGGTTVLKELPKVKGNATYTAVFGNEVDRYVGGALSDKVNWKIDRTTGTLIISGTGAMPNWAAPAGSENHFDNRPWMPYMTEIQHVVVESGITTIGSFAFCHLDSLISVKIADTVTRINQDGFSYNAALKELYIPASVTSIGQGATYQSNNLKTVYGGWETVAGLLKAIGNTAYNDALKAAEYVSTYVAPEPEPNPDAGITPKEDKITLEEGESGKIEATVIPAFPEDSTDLIFRTDSDCITLNADGTFTAVKAGTATVTITTAAGLTATVTVTVTEKAPVANPDAGITPKEDKITLEEGENGKIEATVIPAFPEDSTDLIFTTDSDCITLNADGTFTAVKAGTATVTITTAAGLSATVTVTVTAADNPPQTGDNAVYATIAVCVASLALVALVLKKRSRI